MFTIILDYEGKAFLFNRGKDHIIDENIRCVIKPATIIDRRDPIPTSQPPPYPYPHNELSSIAKAVAEQLRIALATGNLPYDQESEDLEAWLLTTAITILNMEEIRPSWQS